MLFCNPPGSGNHTSLGEGVDCSAPWASRVDSRDCSVHPGVEWTASRVDSRDCSVYPGVEWTASRVDSRGRSVYPGVEWTIPLPQGAEQGFRAVAPLPQGSVISASRRVVKTRGDALYQRRVTTGSSTSRRSTRRFLVHAHPTHRTLPDLANDTRSPLFDAKLPHCEGNPTLDS